MAPAVIDDRDWSALALGERIRQIELEGYVVLPEILSADQVARLKAETASFKNLPHGLQREKVMIAPRAGSAVLIHSRVFHGTYPNIGNRSRSPGRWSLP